MCEEFATLIDLSLFQNGEFKSTSVHVHIRFLYLLFSVWFCLFLALLLLQSSSWRHMLYYCQYNVVLCLFELSE
jgi:hypothetical protein